MARAIARIDASAIGLPVVPDSTSRQLVRLIVIVIATMNLLYTSIVMPGSTSTLGLIAA